MKVEYVDCRSPEIVMQPHERQNVDLWHRELEAAGWKAERTTLWRDPEGQLHLGPFGAWRKLKTREGREVIAV